jgi:hypothetical protein
MDEVIRDLVVVALIGAVLFVGAAEYVYWRFGFDKIVDCLTTMKQSEMMRLSWQHRARIEAAGRKTA